MKIYQTITGLLVLIASSFLNSAWADAPSRDMATMRLSTAQMFGFADNARDRGDYATAEAAYRALATNPDIELRTEARFRLAMMFANRQHKYGDAGVLLRRILDEKPKAARVRLELARIDALLGRMGAASRELRAAQVAGLPPAIEQEVRFYAQALDARRPLGGSFSVSIAPDTNINHATSSNTLNTIIGNFTLSNEAQARSGIGVATQGQVFARLAVSNRASVLAQLSGSANIYSASAFDDLIVAPQIGPEVDLGHDRLTLSAGPAWRWYGNIPYTFSLAASGNWQHALSAREQLRLDVSYAHIDNRRAALESGNNISVAVGLDRALSARLGGGVQVSGNRQMANDPGYATAGGAVSVYAWREISRTTITANLSYSHLEADARLFLFPARRVDDDMSASVGIIFRRLRVGTIAPLVRFHYDRNVSKVQLYDYKRFSGEIGIATAF